MCTLNESLGKSFCSGSCPVSEGNIVCGERRTLDIINEFKRLYENKMDEINKANCGDCLQEKLKLQQDWINDLSEQNELLVKAVEELEIEATERVKMLEDKLQRSAECICEVMKKYRETDVANSILEEPRRKIFNLENDVKNLLEFLRRIREEQQWSTGGLVFYEISDKDLLGDKCVEEILNETIQESFNSDLVKGRKKIVEQDRQLHDLERRTSEVEDLSRELKSTREECETLQKNMADMRQVLTEEVAVKHDAILKLKREYQELEERCIQADKQTAFRDDIIKELRKEIKQLKQQVPFPEKPYSQDSILKKEIKGEQVLVVNHCRKTVQIGNTTVIYLRHGFEMNGAKRLDLCSKESVTSGFVKDYTSTSEVLSKSWSNSLSKETGDVTRKSVSIKEEEKCDNAKTCVNRVDNSLISACKSENDLSTYTNTLKKASSLNTLARRNTFIEDSHSKKSRDNLEKKFISVPDHVPVKLLINNLEVNKQQKN